MKQANAVAEEIKANALRYQEESKAAADDYALRVKQESLQYADDMLAFLGRNLQRSGGEGSFGGTFFGVMIYFVINTLFTYLNGISVNWQSVIMGVLVLVSVGMQSEVFQNIKLKIKK